VPNVAVLSVTSVFSGLYNRITYYTK